jgi:glycosyltransferase involved in cell wall biosynthesis
MKTEIPGMVSVIITTFNRGSLVANAIESALHQTYTNYEIIVIDDGSTDDTPTRLRPYLGCIQYFRQENRGVSVAGNTGIELARGEWIAILDSDDIWLPRKLELQLATVAAMGPEFGVCFTNSAFAGKAEAPYSAFEQAGFHSNVQSAPLDEPVEYVLARHPTIHRSSLLIKRCLVEGLDGFDSELPPGEDTDLLFRLCFRTKFCFVNAPLANINWADPFARDRLSWLIIAQKGERMFRSRVHMYKKWLHFLDHQRDEVMRQKIHTSLKLVYYDWLISKVKLFRWSDAIKLAKQITQMGDSYWTIGTSLFARGVKRAFRQTLNNLHLRLLQTS